MLDKEKSDEYIVEKLLSSSEARETRKIAHEISSIVFSIRTKDLFSEIFEDQTFDKNTVDALRSLLNDFRDKVRTIIPNKQIPESDDDLYSQVILPLVLRQIDHSA